MGKTLKIIAKIVIIPVWFISGFLCFFIWVGLFNGYKTWYEVFIKEYFSL